MCQAIRNALHPSISVNNRPIPSKSISTDTKDAVKSNATFKSPPSVIETPCTHTKSPPTSQEPEESEELTRMVHIYSKTHRQYAYFKSLHLNYKLMYITISFFVITECVHLSHKPIYIAISFFVNIQFVRLNYRPYILLFPFLF